MHLCNFEYLVKVTKNRDLVISLYSDFFNLYNENIQDIKKYMTEENFIELKKSTHYLVGSLLYIGTDKCKKTAKKLDNSAKEKDINSCFHYCTLLEKEINDIKESYQKIVQTN